MSASRGARIKTPPVSLAFPKQLPPATGDMKVRRHEGATHLQNIDGSGGELGEKPPPCGAEAGFLNLAALFSVAEVYTTEYTR